MTLKGTSTVMNTFVFNGGEHSRFHHAVTGPRLLARTVTLLLSRGALACGLLGLATSVGAQVNGVAQRPYLGWSSYSQQTLDANFLTQANVAAQSDALASSGLQAHGFNYINMDSGWHGGFDANGRPIPRSLARPITSRTFSPYRTRRGMRSAHRERRRIITRSISPSLVRRPISIP